MIIIGIDPGKQTGFAVKNLETGQFIGIATMKIHEAIAAVYNLISLYPEQVYAVIEDARKRKWFGNTGREKLQGVGSVKRDCSIWADFLNDAGVDVRFEAPRKGATKWDEGVWKRATGWKERTSEHARDAALLIHGMNARNLKIYFPEKKLKEKVK